MIKPKKIFRNGLRNLANLTLYSQQKSHAKGKAEITFIGEQKVENVRSQLFVFDDCVLEEKDDLPVEDFFVLKDSAYKDKVLWLNFHGLHDIELFEKLGEITELDRFTIRQIVDTTLRPKIDEFETYLFFSVKSILSKNDHLLKIEQLSFVLGDNFLISFQEEKGDHFDHIRGKLRECVGVVRRKNSDFLLVQLLDAILDNYFETIEIINTEISHLEQEVLNSPRQETLIKLEKNKKSIELIKKSLKPFREALVAILNDRTTFIKKGNKKYFRDLKNNCSNATEEADTSLKIIEGLTNIYFSSLSHKMNEIMKVLTTVSTIFIPLTFIVGVYGMNFEYMPELKLKDGYLYVWLVMGLILIGMIIYFKRKKWL